MPPSPAMNETRHRKPARTGVCGTVSFLDTPVSRITWLLTLLFHDAVLEAWRQTASVSFHHAQRERLRHQHCGDALPGLRYRLHPNREEPLGRLALFCGN